MAGRPGKIRTQNPGKHVSLALWLPDSAGLETPHYSSYLGTVHKLHKRTKPQHNGVVMSVAECRKSHRKMRA